MKGFSAVLAFIVLVVLFIIGAFMTLLIAGGLAKTLNLGDGGTSLILILSEVLYIIIISRLLDRYTKDKPDQ